MCGLCVSVCVTLFTSFSVSSVKLRNYIIIILCYCVRSPRYVQTTNSHLYTFESRSQWLHIAWLNHHLPTPSLYYLSMYTNTLTPPRIIYYCFDHSNRHMLVLLVSDCNKYIFQNNTVHKRLRGCVLFMICPHPSHFWSLSHNTHSHTGNRSAPRLHSTEPQHEHENPPTSQTKISILALMYISLGLKLRARERQCTGSAKRERSDFAVVVGRPQGL